MPLDGCRIRAPGLRRGRAAERRSIAGDDVSSMPANEVRALVAKKGTYIAQERPGKQVEIFVVHQNVIRYFFLKLLQFDTTAWLNFGGSNCTTDDADALDANRQRDL